MDSGPIRMCVVCGKRFLKKDLNRYTADENGALMADESGKRPGRGYYLCSDEDCARRFTKKARSPKKRQGR
ncbi:MAG: DUF448 domain-containing protein [Desulfovibrio sp.]|nr:DUF448 domain-containing protein [Desulfovibrio sp.]